jgi:hypothetical protein
VEGAKVISDQAGVAAEITVEQQNDAREDQQDQD